MGYDNASAALALLKTEVHIWQASLAVSSSALQQYAQTLSANEQERANRFRFPHDSQRYIASRGILRNLLGHYAKTSPHQLQFCYGSYGKPALAEDFAALELEFNLSHSDEMMVCAIAHRCRVGIDLEHLRSVAYLENVTQRFFSPQEHAVIHALPANLRVRSFFQHWTCKEALLKAIGVGLMELSTIELFIQDDTATLVRWDDKQHQRPWSLQLFTPGLNYIGAVAIDSPERALVFRQWQHIT